MKIQVISFSSLFIFFTNSISVTSYNYNMHRYLGELTEGYLEKNNNELYINLKSIILEPLSNASIWPDQIKRTKKYWWTSKLHYIDIAKSECFNSNKNYDNLIDKYCENCVINSIIDFATVLKNKTEYHKYNPDYIIPRNEIFKFLIHFIQDFNQPMHVFGGDRGGNNFKLIRNKNGRNKTTNVHSMWDSEIPEYFIQNYNYTIPNITFTKNYKELIVKTLGDNFNLACKIYPNTNFIIFEEYFKQEYMKILFDNYFTLIINTLHYIFN